MHNPLESNLDVDYVVVYRVPKDDRGAAIQQFTKLIRALSAVGLQTSVRDGDGTSLLVFVKAADEQVLNEIVYRSRIKDWLHGVRQIQPIKETAQTLVKEPLTDAERLRQIHHIITCPDEEGGAGILPGWGEWKNVEAVFPLHDHTRNKKWLTEFATKTLLTPDDIDHIRNAVGEKIAYYYSFLQTYFQFMIFPAAFGFSCWVLLGNFSPIYAVVNAVWCVIFVEYWKRQELELSIRWGVKNVSSIEDKRKEFRPEKHTRDPVTGEDVAYFPARQRLLRQLLQIPLAIVTAISLGTIICFSYAIEIFISEVYSGPFKYLLVYTPTVILTLAVPTVSGYLTKWAAQLTDYENYDTQEAHDQAMISKVFVINFITSYLAMFLTSFVYVPFASVLVPYLDVFSLTVKPLAEHEKQISTPPPGTFSIDPNRLRNQMFFFAVTGQVINFAMETVVPLITQRGTKKYQEYTASRAEKKGGIDPSASANDPPEEREFLARVRDEAALPEYDVTTDLREMCIQFGYLSMFSVVWPLTPVAYFINDWIELRGDTFKLTVESRRPNPARADSIGPWLNSLEFLAWMGSITSAALSYMFSNGGKGPDGKPTQIHLGFLFLSVFISEHVFLVVRAAVRMALSKLDTANVRKERSERYMVRMKYLEDAGLGEAIKPLKSPTESPLLSRNGEKMGEVITRKSLEEDEREESLHDSTPERRFWKRQRGWQESEQVGARLIEMMNLKDAGTKKAQ